MGYLEDQVRQNTLTLQAIADNAKKIKDLTTLGLGLDGTESVAIQLGNGETMNTTMNSIADFLGVLGGIKDIFAGEGVEIDKADPLNPIITAKSVYVNVSQIEIDGKFFHLWKHPDNNDPLNLETLEIKDIIKGFDKPTRYMEAIYLGGDESLFEDLTIYSIFAGTVY